MELTEREDRVTDAAAALIVAAARAMHPGDPVRIAEAALRMTDDILASADVTPVLYEGTKRYPRTPAETEDRINGVRHPYGQESR